MSSSILWALLAVIVLVNAIIVGVLIFRLLTPFARKLLLALAGLEIALVVLHLAFAGQPGSFASWFFDLNREYTAGAVFSSAQYTAMLLVALINAMRIPALKLPQRAIWLLLAAMFAWLAADEFFSLHEEVMTWRSAYAIGGAAVVSAAAAAYWLWFRGQRVLFVPLLVGLVIMGTSGVLLDAITNDHVLVVAGVEMRWLLWFSCDGIIPIPCSEMNALGFIEEYFELAGATIVLTSLVSYSDSMQAQGGLRAVKRAVAAAAALWTVLFAIYMWMAPALSLVLDANPAQVDYIDGRLSLAGYRLPDRPLQPGETLPVTLYFRANAPLQDDYRLAVRVTPRYSEEVLDQTDFQLGEWQYPSSAWIAGIAVRNRASLRIPADIQTPRSYWLIAQVWSENGEVSIVASDRQQLTPDTVVLAELPILSNGTTGEPHTAAAYRFAAGMTLTGYTLPASSAPGATLGVDFWWETDSKIEHELNQYVHLFNVQGEFVWGYDQAPFGAEVFPTMAWPAGMHEAAHWEIVLPADLPPGNYSVYTGLYSLPDITPQAVTDAQGQPVPNNAIPLGTLTVKGS